MKRHLEVEGSAMTNEIKLRNDHLTLEYRPCNPMLKSIGKATHHLAKMGIRRADGDFLRIEEALYLVELGAAIVLNQRQNSLTIAHLFSLLCSMNISLFKYSVYSQLVRAGYVVRKPSDISAIDDSSSSTYAVRACAFHFSQQLLDQFPSIISSSDERLAVSLHIPPIQSVLDNGTPMPTKLLHNDNDAIDGDSDDMQCLTLDNLNAQMNAHVREIEDLLLRDVRRQHTEPWNSCRPRWWPSLRSLNSLDSWRVYALRRDALLQKRRQQNRRTPIERRSWLCEPALAYKLFPDERNGTKPIYDMIIIEPFSLIGAQSQENFGELNKLSTDCNSRGTQLLVATGTPNCVKITQFVAESDESLRVPQEDGNE